MLWAGHCPGAFSVGPGMFEYLFIQSAPADITHNQRPNASNTGARPRPTVLFWSFNSDILKFGPFDRSTRTWASAEMLLQQSVTRITRPHRPCVIPSTALVPVQTSSQILRATVVLVMSLGS